MKFLIYVNQNKDVSGEFLNSTVQTLKSLNQEYMIIDRNDFTKKINADALIVLGGDGTILDLNGFSNVNDIPILGINAGKLGFLTEFEKFEITNAIKSLIDEQLIIDERINIELNFDGKKYIALNEVCIQRIFGENGKGMVIKVDVEIDGNTAERLVGDGVIVCTPTGSTAYSLSAGGAILAPGINAFCFTPISAHSLSHRPIVFSSSHVCKLTLLSGEKAGVLVDGRMVKEIKQGESVVITCHDKKTKFLRKKESNFFNVLTRKLKDNRGE